ncbi:hypothetical protein AB4305_15805 [Nocardia sp. 2YAB30]|uniref:hypothetical protein n=1 Tax=unclassified Nocardia TaxID=2637762 RepID=UPI003F96198D
MANDYDLTVYNNAAVDSLIIELDKHYDAFIAHKEKAETTDGQIMDACHGASFNDGYKPAFDGMKASLVEILDSLKEGTRKVGDAADGIHATDKQIAGLFGDL